jgi:hypothetical protein
MSEETALTFTPEEAAAFSDPAQRKEMIEAAYAEQPAEPEEPASEEATDDLPADESGEEEQEGGELGEETTEEEAPEEDEEAAPEGKIPPSLLRAEKEKRRALEAKLAESDAKLNSVLELMNKMLDAAEQPEGKAAPEAEADEWLDDKAKAKTEELEQRQIKAQFLTDAKLEYIQAIQKTPDFDDAYAFYQEKVAGDLKKYAAERNKVLTDEQARAMAKSRIDTGLFHRWQEGLPIAEAVYERAKDRGYKKADTRPKGDRPNINAIKRNQERAGKPDAERVPIGGDMSVNALQRRLEKIQKENGGVIPPHLIKQLAGVKR